MDSMDMKTMEQFVFDTLYQQYSGYSEEELISEIRDYYDDEVLESFGIEIKEVPDSVTPD
jgi:predicted Zn-dependent protease with MMP-like domain